MVSLLVGIYSSTIVTALFADKLVPITEHLDILNLTPEEKRVFRQLFTQADTDSSGVITGEVAVKFLEKTNVPGAVLGEVIR